jgi:hypothetical protein
MFSYLSEMLTGTLLARIFRHHQYTNLYEALDPNADDTFALALAEMRMMLKVHYP